MTWVQAEAYCVSLGGHLASISVMYLFAEKWCSLIIFDMKSFPIQYHITHCFFCNTLNDLYLQSFFLLI